MKNGCSAAFVLLAALLPLPIYIVTTPDGVSFAPLLAFDGKVNEIGFGLPIALIGIAAVSIFWLVEVIHNPRILINNYLLIVIALIAWTTVAILTGLWSSDRPLFSFALYAQTILPVAMLGILLTLPISDDAFRRSTIVVPVASALSLAVILAGTAYFTNSLQHTNAPLGWALVFMSEAVYGLKTSFPVIVAAGISLLLYQLAPGKRLIPAWLVWLMLIVHAGFLLINWSRSGLAAIIIIVILWSVISIVRSRQNLMPVAAVAVLFGAAAFLSGQFAGISLRPSTSETMTAAADQFAAPQDKEEDSDDKLSDSRRWALLKGGFDRIAASPLVGDAFKPLPAGTDVAGQPARGHTVFPSHNQLIDLGVRAGAPTMALYSLLLLTISIGLWLRFWQFGSELSLVMLVFLIGVTAGSLMQAYYVVTQTAVLIFLLATMGLRISGQERFRQLETQAPVSDAVHEADRSPKSAAFS